MGYCSVKLPEQILVGAKIVRTDKMLLMLACASNKWAQFSGGLAADLP